MYLDNERRPTLTPQLAFRVAVIGGVALVAFAVIFFRLWYLQVLSGDKYEAQARGNVVREIKVQAPRGEIVDRDGNVLVDNRSGLALVVSPDKMPEDEAERRDVYERLGRLLRMKADRIERRAERDLKALPFSSATVKRDVPDAVAAYVLERQDQFEGVDVERQFVRKYPHGEIGAHLFGTVGEVTREQLEDERNNGVVMGDRIASCAASTAPPRSRSTRSATSAGGCVTTRPSRAGSCACRSTSTCRRRARTRSRAGRARAHSPSWTSTTAR
jgi:penicillin-binding protein 2